LRIGPVLRDTGAMGALIKNRWVQAGLLAILVIGLALAVKAWSDTMGDPVIKRLVIESSSLPAGSAPVTIALLADIHVAGPDMPPERLEKIVAQVNALKPDLVAIAGDLVSDKIAATKIYTPEQIVTPLGKLKATHGVVVVPGNHDHWYDWPGLSAQLARHQNITVLANKAAQFGPFAVGGVDDASTGKADVEATAAQMQLLSGPRIFVSHSPDVFPDVPVNVDLVLAGHTHCGQIAYPWGGSPATMSAYGERFACGVAELHGKTLVTSGGLGTTLLPVRLFTTAEIWLIEIRPPQR
jgi:hypothetical protein